MVKPNTKMICLNNANNPTGTVLDKEFLEQVVEIAKSVDAYVLVDEVCPSIIPKNLRRLLTFMIGESLLILFQRLIRCQGLGSVGPRLTLKLPMSSVNSVITP